MLEGLILLIILLVLIFTGIPVALAMALSGILGMLVFGGTGLFIEAGRTIWGATFSWLLVSVPFFLVMAEFMSKGRLAERMFAGLSKVTAGVRGSLAMAVVVGCTLFGLTTGGGITEVAAIGRISIPEMRKRGYDIRLTLGSIAASGALGFLIPPSIFLIIYGAWANLSVAKLFAGGLIPGFVMAVFLMASVAIQLRLNPGLAPVTSPLPVKERVKGLFATWPILVVGMMVLGLIFTGVATPTEAAGIGALLALLIIIIIPSSRKQINYNFFKDSLANSVRFTAVIMFIIAGAQILAFVWGFLGVPVTVAKWVSGMDLSPIWVMASIYIIWLVAGAIMDAISMMVLTLPILLPLATGAGYDPIWFGVMMGMLIGCAQITPPVGMSLYTVRAIFPEYGFGTIVRGSMPFLYAELACIALLTAFPQIALWLPHLIYGS